MKKSILSLLFILLFFLKNNYAQTDTVFLNQKEYVCDKKEAFFYRVSEKISDKEYLFLMYNMKHQLLKKYFSLSAGSVVKNGIYEEYDTLKNIVSKGTYLKGFKVSEWDYFYNFSRILKEKNIYNDDKTYDVYQYDSITQKLSWQGKIDYFGKNTGQCFQYFYDSDRIKNKFNYLYGKKEGEQLEYYISGNIKRIEKFENNKLKQGKMFQEDGKEIKFFPVFVYPKYNEYVSNYLLREEKCAALALKQKDFQVSIIISKEGNVINAVVNDVDDEICTQKIRNALLRMKKWKPAYYENNAVKYTFSTTIKLYLQKEY